MNSNLSKHQRIHAVLACQKIEEFKGRHAYLHALGKGREEYGTFWLRSDNATWGHTFGRMVGFKEMMMAHFANFSMYQRMDGPGGGPGDGPGGPTPLSQEAPDENISGPGEMIGGPSGRVASKVKRTDRPTTMQEIYGDSLHGHDPSTTFNASCHVLASSVIEVADDGMSARSFYLTPGTMMSVNGDQGGRRGLWLWERYGSDFLFRDGKWWWCHEQVCPDLTGDFDAENWAQDRYRKYLDNKLIVGRCSGPPRSGISDLRSAHNDVSIIQTVQDTVPCPVPYDTLSEENTYTPGYNDFSKENEYPSTGGYGDYAD